MSEPTPLAVFEYSYRDAANYSVHDSLLLAGQIDVNDIKVIECALEAGEFFIAEQVGIPPLYEPLWRYSNGPNGDDHVWHTYRGIRAARREDLEDFSIHVALSELATRFRLISQWDLSISPHFDVRFT